MDKKTMDIIHKIGKSSFIKSISKVLFKKTYHKYLTAQEELPIKAFKEYGMEALSKFDECMRKNNFNYTLAYGSILGAIREKGFIKHDFDIDTYMWIEDFNPDIITELNKCGFNWVNNYSIADGKYGREDTFQYKGVNIDVFYIYPPINKYPYSCIFIKEEGMEDHERMPRRIELPVSKERREVSFESLRVFIPDNSEEICEMRYGPKYMTPDPSWDWIKAKEMVVDWREKINETVYTKNPEL